MGLIKFLFSKMFSGGKSSVSTATKNKIASDWTNIEQQLKGGSPSQLRQALITADKSLDNAMQDVVVGETMGERLKNAKDKFDYTTYDKLWKAHKMRNALVHESGYEPPHHMLKKGIEDLRRGLVKLGVPV